MSSLHRMLCWTATATTVASIVSTSSAFMVAPSMPSTTTSSVLRQPASTTSLKARSAGHPSHRRRLLLPTYAAADGKGADEGIVGPQPAPKGFAKKETAASMNPNAPSSTQDIDRMNTKQKMAYWEIQKEMEKEVDMKEIAEYEETQRLLEEGQVGYLPEKISNRMLQRLLPFIFFPILGAAGMFAFYIYLAKNTEWDVPPAFVAFSTQVPFLAAIVGITYSIMSTSWDPDVEGSFWGVTEFKTNVINLLDSLQKSKREERALEKIKKYEKKAPTNRAKRRELDRLTKQ